MLTILLLVHNEKEQTIRAVEHLRTDAEHRSRSGYADLSALLFLQLYLAADECLHCLHRMED